ncbi:hypothetical protein CONPUDRAFT_53439, partial [Coniophora puteana RWD-64-598 SS2]
MFPSHRDVVRPPVPVLPGAAHDLLLDPLGVRVDANGEVVLSMCSVCKRDLSKSKLPRLALANNNYLGPVPAELHDLTVVEEAMIALCRPKTCIVQLSDPQETAPISHATANLRSKNYSIGPIATCLPASTEDITTMICVLFVGSTPPTAEWMQTHAKPLLVRREKVRAALQWLKRNNHHYRHIQIDDIVINNLPVSGILP